MRTDSTRWWNLTFGSLPTLLFSTFGHHLVEDIGQEVFIFMTATCLLNSFILVVQLSTGYPHVIVNSVYVYDLAMYRLLENNEVYERLLGPESHIDPDLYGSEEGSVDLDPKLI